jgi:hypothetical protein
MDHGNIKLQNVFVEYQDKFMGGGIQKVPVIVLSDRCMIGKPTSDAKAIANVMH